jgi:hypothetical protein
MDVAELYMHNATEVTNQNYKRGYRGCPGLGQQEVYNGKCEKTGYRTTGMREVHERKNCIYTALYSTLKDGK